MHSKRKIPDSWRTDWKAKACTSFALYLKVLKNHFWFVLSSACIRECCLQPWLHTQLPEHNRSYWKVSRGWGHLINWNELIMGHLNSFSASGGGNLNKNFPKFQMPGGCPGGMFRLRFDWYIMSSKWVLKHKKIGKIASPVYDQLEKPYYSRMMSIIVVALLISYC